jgi:hypothetical protein
MEGNGRMWNLKTQEIERDRKDGGTERTDGRTDGRRVIQTRPLVQHCYI